MPTDSVVLQWAAVQFWQLSLVIIAVGGLASVLARRRPHLAYALWLIVLLKAVTPPIWSSNLGLFARWDVPDWMGQAKVSTVLQPVAAELPVADMKDTGTNDTAPPATDPVVEKRSAASASYSSASTETLSAIWLVGSLGMVLLAGVILVFRERTITRTSIPAHRELVNTVTDLAKKMGIGQPVRVVVSAKGLGPAVCGVWRPTLLLPECVVGDKNPTELLPILTHELVHLRRGDHIVAVLQCVVQTIWWFHPLVWWANVSITRVRERCCDLESVQELSGGSARYARCLVDVLAAKEQLRPVYGFPGVRPMQVTSQRVKEIMAMSTSVPAKNSVWQWLAVLVLAVILLPGAPLTRMEPTSAEEAGSQAANSSATSSSATSSDTAKDSTPLRLEYGDGKADGKKSIAGAGEMIRFELPGDTGKVRALRVHGSRYGYPQPPKEDIEISLLSEDMSEVLHTELVPYSLFKRGGEGRWTYLPFREPVEVPKQFWVVLNFNAERTKGVYVSYDTSTHGQYSRIGFSNEDARETDFQGDWMVQVLLAK